MWDWRLFTPSYDWWIGRVNGGEGRRARHLRMTVNSSAGPPPPISPTHVAYPFRDRKIKFSHPPKSCLIGEGHDTLDLINHFTLLSLHSLSSLLRTAQIDGSPGLSLCTLTIPSALPATSNFTESNTCTYWRRLGNDEYWYCASRVESGSDSPDSPVLT
jgi:hypothetical protein